MTKKKILIVDDDPVARQIMNALLRTNYQTIMSGDAIGAFSEARKQNPDLVILDLGLPGGGGFIVLQRLKSVPALSVVPVIVVSGLDRASHEQKALDEGADRYVQKPADEQKLLEMIQDLIGA
ncbi:MAG TPA: response regulator [Thermoanaerobaculia bacterium]